MDSITIRFTAVIACQTHDRLACPSHLCRACGGSEQQAVVLGLDLGLDWAALVFVIQHTLIRLPAFPRLVCRSRLANSSQQGLLQKYFCLK